MPEDPTPESLPVFLSYARKASREHAVAVYEALKKLGIQAFLDTEEIDAGDSFPERLVDSLLGARVVVVFAEPEYFHRWYCLLEFRIARTPFLRAIQNNAGRREREAALAPLVIAFPEPGTSLSDLDRFPALVRATNWPPVTDPAAVADLVRVRLGKSKRTIGELLDSLPGSQGADHFREMLLDADRLPPPLQLNTMPAVRPPEGSIHDAFVGRADDLWRIHDALTTHWGDVATAAGLTGALEGGGGFGKTRLAVEYFFRFGPKHYPGGLFWINAELDPEPQQYEIIRRLDPGVPAQLKDFRDAGGNVAWRLDELLRGLSDDTPALVVVDNVPEPRAGESPLRLETWVPAVGEVPLLVTSRTRVSAAHPGAVVPLRVDVLNVDDAVALLQRGDVDRDALSADEWRRIAEWVGRLPLALELLNGLLANGGATPLALLTKTSGASTTEALDAAMDALRGSVPAGALRGISEALSESYRRLSPEAQAAVRKLAFLAPEPIPEELVEAMGGLFSPEARIALVGRSFVTRAPGGAVLMFGSMHRVLADFLRTLAQDPIKDLSELGMAAIDGLTGERCRDPREWPSVNALMPHLHTLFARLREGVTHPSIASVWVSVGLRLGIVLSAQGQVHVARSIEEDVLATARRWLGDSHPRTLTAMSNLANTYWANGELLSAKELQERVVELSPGILGEDHYDTLRTLNNLANTYFALGDTDKARSLLARTVDGTKRKLGEEHPDTLRVMNNLAQIFQAQGDLPKAELIQSSVLEVSKKVFGEEHPDTLRAMGNLAEMYRAQGHLSLAEELQARVLENTSQVLGDEHPDTLRAMSNLAEIYRARRELHSAREIQERVLQVARQSLGEEHPETLRAMNNLAGTYGQQGDTLNARVLQEIVWGLRRRLVGEEHPDTLIAMSNLAGTYLAEGKLTEAQQLQERVLVVRRRDLGTEHPRTTVAAWNLLRTLLSAGSTKDAAEIISRELRWLLNRDLSSLDADQKEIRRLLELLLWPADDQP